MASPSDRAPIALLTGAEGFTGRYVRASLERAGYRVAAWSHGGGEGEAVNLLDRDATLSAAAQARPDVVVHLAAISFVAHGDADEIYRVNVVGTRNLLEGLAASEHKPRRVLLASSANVYGNAEGSVDEQVAPAPQNDYAVSKLAMEFMANLWRSQLPITITRPFNYTGVGQSDKFLIPKIVSHFKRKADHIELGNLDVSRDFYDVRGVAEIYTRLTESATADDVFNVCSGQEYSLREVIALMESISGHRMDVRVNPAFVRANEVKRLRGDAGRLARAIGPLPQIPLRDTLEWMYRNEA
ncbi:NAD-dependent epimerase/dehydratase family protein [Lysobacter sp. MMG2]|uniref:NAD-dependent epimerase/dehydratase family protein n=1 Tax=Lysobacter sp. MMG2 TaxID=2801338 RepID=UPI001C22F4F4|nr:NAD-dependent epimerase/dehydratase family protein [Lysobacter sp. MMG2]